VIQVWLSALTDAVICDPWMTEYCLCFVRACGRQALGQSSIRIAHFQAARTVLEGPANNAELARFYIAEMKTIAKRLVLRL
jgi:hypothetical protein